MQQGGPLQCGKCLGPVGSYCIGGKIKGQSRKQWGLLECYKCLGSNVSY